jgi:DNA-binding transcriptional LysR family regulator
VQFTILSRPWSEIALMLNNLEIDAAIAYVDVEPLSRVTTIPLYRERYQLVTAKHADLAQRNSVTWAEVAAMPLCLLTPDTQSRRIVDGLLRDASATPNIMIESDSIAVLLSHVQTGSWVSIIPGQLVQTSSFSDELSIVPIVEPEVTHTIGLVMPVRDPATPLANALAGEARRTAAEMIH